MTETEKVTGRFPNRLSPLNKPSPGQTAERKDAFDLAQARWLILHDLLDTLTRGKKAWDQFISSLSSIGYFRDSKDRSRAINETPWFVEICRKFDSLEILQRKLYDLEQCYKRRADRFILRLLESPNTPTGSSYITELICFRLLNSF